MSKKVGKIANLLFLIGIVFMFICLTTSIKVNAILLASLIVGGILLITKLLYKNSFFEKLSKDKKIVMFIYFFVICLIELLIMVNHFSLVLLLNYLIIDFSLLVTYLFVRRTGGNEKALLVIPGSLLFLPYLLENSTSNYLLSLFVPVSLVYLILSFDSLLIVLICCSIDVMRSLVYDSEMLAKSLSRILSLSAKSFAMRVYLIKINF